jgi:hypothetical protein
MLVCGVVYDSNGLLGVMIIRPRVTSVLQIVSESTITVSRICMGHLIRIQ